MKRFFSLLLAALMLCVMASPAMADGYGPSNLQAFADMMDSQGFTYEWSDDGSYITSEFNIDECGLEECDLWIWGYDHGLKVQADIPYQVDSRDMDELAKFIVLMNQKLVYGEFYLDYEYGYCGFEMFTVGYQHTVSQNDLYFALVMAVNTLEDYGDGILAITDNGYTAEQAFALYF